MRCAGWSSVTEKLYMTFKTKNSSPRNLNLVIILTPMSMEGSQNVSGALAQDVRALLAVQKVAGSSLAHVSEFYSRSSKRKSENLYKHWQQLFLSPPVPSQRDRSVWGGSMGKKPRSSWTFAEMFKCEKIKNVGRICHNLPHKNLMMMMTWAAVSSSEHASTTLLLHGGGGRDPSAWWNPPETDGVSAHMPTTFVPSFITVNCFLVVAAFSQEGAAADCNMNAGLEAVIQISVWPLGRKGCFSPSSSWMKFSVCASILVRTYVLPGATWHLLLYKHAGLQLVTLNTDYSINNL